MPDDISREAVVREARRWLGTPYHHHARLLGVGVDCAQLLIGVYSAVGLAQPFDPGAYPTQWHLHHDEERYIAWVERYAPAVDVPAAGDIVLVKFGRTYSHGGIVGAVLPMTIVHAYVHGGCTEGAANQFPFIDEKGHARPMLFYSFWQGGA